MTDKTAASGPKAKKTNVIVFASASILPASLAELLAGISIYARQKNDYTIRVIPASELGNRDAFSNCDGVILDVVDDKVREVLTEMSLPTVDLSKNSVREYPHVVPVLSDEGKCGAIAAEWFVRRGFRSFAYCGMPWNSESNELLRGFSSTLAKAGFECRDFEYRPPVESRTVATLVSALEPWIRTLPRRTAVLCAHDKRALNVISVCMKLGRSVPDDIAVMGRYNDRSISACSPVSITSVDMNMRGLGAAAMRILAHMIDHPPNPKPGHLFRVRPLGIVERESTAVYPVEPPWLASALMWLDGNLDRPASVQDLAEAAGVSQTALQTEIRRAFGMSAAKYILSAKMREAKQLVDEGCYSVKEIAAKTGFSAPNHFSRTYHAYYGRPPASDRPSSL